MDKKELKRLQGWYSIRPKLVAPTKKKEDGLYLLNPYGYECAGPYKYIDKECKGIYSVGNTYRYRFLVNDFGEPISDNIFTFYVSDKGFRPIELDKKFGFIALDYGAVCLPKFEDICITNFDQPIKVKMNGLWGYVDMEFQFHTWEECEKRKIWDNIFRVAKEIYLYWQ